MHKKKGGASKEEEEEEEEAVIEDFEDSDEDEDIKPSPAKKMKLDTNGSGTSSQVCTFFTTWPSKTLSFLWMLIVTYGTWRPPYFVLLINHCF